ncbi:hypothetical protein RIF29_11224 [Crotalaria pallida]|uniref:Uncharacterized protein n=1 Tax=Crotalaria pallida TaxID=3830 RepID=A0AAN9ILX5_CROPI
MHSQTMKGSSCFAYTNTLYSSLPLSNDNYHVKVAKVRNMGFKVNKNNHSWPNYASCCIKQGKDNNGFVVGCASWSLVEKMEKELEAEMNAQEDEEKASTGMGRFRDKCGEGKGVVEMLECLEREAIMGEDVGKEPMDYNRRAQIFDRSSKVFQALKEQEH